MYCCRSLSSRLLAAMLVPRPPATTPNSLDCHDSKNYNWYSQGGRHRARRFLMVEARDHPQRLWFESAFFALLDLSVLVELSLKRGLGV